MSKAGLKELQDQIMQDTGCSRAKADEMLKAVVGAIRKVVKANKGVTIVDSFTISISKRNGRTCKVPKTGEIVAVPPYNTAVMKIGKGFKDELNS